MKEVFVLPDKWAIRSTHITASIIADYASITLSRRVMGFKGGGTWFHFPEIERGICTSSGLKDDYTEITFEEFEKYVLNKPKGMKTVKISSELLQEAFEAASINQKQKMRLNVDAFALLVSETFVKEMYNEVCEGWKERLEKEFPSLFPRKVMLPYIRNTYERETENFLMSSSSKEGKILLGNKFDWKLENEDGNTYLVPTRK